MGQRRILVINPNSNTAVTEKMSEALEPFRLADGPIIDCMTLDEGPLGIESQADVERVTIPLSRLVADQDAAAYVIACYSDPGLHVCRESTSKPVFGIAESAIMQAMTMGDRYGVVAILDRSIPRHMRYMRQLATIDRLAGERALNLRVHELLDENLTWDRMLGVGRALRDENGADVIILGCAGMARYRQRLSDELAAPVIDPTQAAVSMAFASALL